MKRHREPDHDLQHGESKGLESHGGPVAAALSAHDHEQVNFHERPAKLADWDCAVEEDDSDAELVDMKCSLPPHREPITFKSYGEFETHYNKFHTNRCLECGKNFPSEHLLGVHIEECHDPLVVVRRDKGEHTYSCFVEGCERKCLTHQKRRMHMIDKHMYPKNFFFAVTKEGIDGRRSLLVEGGHNRRRSSVNEHAKECRRRASLREGSTTSNTAANNTSAAKLNTDAKKPSRPPQQQVGDDSDEEEDEEESKDTDMADLTGAMSALKFVPPSVRFGRGRAGFSKR